MKLYPPQTTQPIRDDALNEFDLVSPYPCENCHAYSKLQTMHQNWSEPKTRNCKNSQFQQLQEPNEKFQLVFLGRIQDEQLTISNVLASMYRYSRYSHAKVYHNSDSGTAIE